MSNLQKNIYWFAFWMLFTFFSIDTMLLLFNGKPNDLVFFILYRLVYYACLILIAYLTRDYTND